MKVLQTWTRPDEYSIVVKYTYSSKYKDEIDKIQERMPLGYILIDTDEPIRKYPRKDIW